MTPKKIDKKPETQRKRRATSSAKPKIVAKNTKTTLPTVSNTNPNQHKKYQYNNNRSPSSFAISSHSHKSNKVNILNYKTNKAQIIIVVALCSLLIIGIGVSKIWYSQDNSNSVNESEKNGAIVENPKTSALQQTSSDKTQAVLKDTGTMIDSSDFSVSTVIRLDVPVYTQTYGQSCEASSLRMALEYRGIKTNDMALLNQMGYDGEVAQKINGKLIWGDPHKQFVGEKDGDQTSYTGYGVFAEPIAAVAQKLGRSTQIQNDVQADWIVEQIFAGNPVILWGVSVKVSDANWQTEEGVAVVVPMRTHTRLVVGFKGDPKNPDGFYLNDPALGKMKYWSTKDLFVNVNQGVKQAVAIY